MTTVTDTEATSLDEVRRALDVRRAALLGLGGTLGPKAGAGWNRDRLSDIDWANRVVAEEARRRGLTPASLIALSTAG